LQAKAEDAEKFRRRLKKLRHLGPRDVLVFEDKTGFSKHPRLSRLWTPCGQRARIPTRNEHRQRLNVFGWVAPLLGRHGMMHLARAIRGPSWPCCAVCVTACAARPSTSMSTAPPDTGVGWSISSWPRIWTCT